MTFDPLLNPMNAYPIHFRNDSGEEIPAYAVVAKNGTVDVDGEMITKGIKTSTTFTEQYMVNGPIAVPVDGFGYAAGWGQVPVAHDTSLTATARMGLGPKPGSWLAWQGFLGLKAVDVFSTPNDVAVCEVSFPLTALLGKTTGAITGGSASTSWRVYAGGTLGSESDAGWTTVPSALSLVDIDSGLWIKLTWLANGWFMEPLECNA